MADEPFKRERLGGYVEPDTMAEIRRVQEEQRKQLGVRFTIGQAVDYLAKKNIENRKGQ